MATSKEWFWYFNSSGQLVSGATITLRAVGGSTTLYTFVEQAPTYPGLYTVIAETGLYDVYFNGVKSNELSPWLHVDSSELPSVTASQTELFGDGSDGTYTLDGTQGTVSGLFTRDSGTQYTMLRDGLFDTLTINNGITLLSNGYRIFAKTLLTNNGTIKNNGGNGNNGTNANLTTPGTAGGASTGSTGNYVQAGSGGSAGGNGGGTTQNGFAGSSGAGTNAIISLGRAGKAGGNGGGGLTGGAAGAAAGSTLAATHGTIRNVINAILSRVFTTSAVVAPQLYTGNAGSGGGAGGGASGGAGGGGASAGGSGGIVIVAAKTFAGAGAIEAVGGTGGTGGNGGNASSTFNGGGGGGGGCGGNGGWIVILYNATTYSGTKSVAGGSPGNGGSGGIASGSGTNGVAGANGDAGLTGIITEFLI